MSACSFNGATMETAHNYEASAIDIVAEQELEREHELEYRHENALCLSPPPQHQHPSLLSLSSSPPQVQSSNNVTTSGINVEENNDHGSGVFGSILRTRAPATILNNNHNNADNTATNHATGASTATASATIENSNSIISLMQSSPPPHSYRHSRAYRHFKNPPQPHMCIRTTTEAGEELFINVLSWTRIVIPQEPSDPIPLYGGMRVPPGSARSPPIVFAVMANPEVLKDSGRHSKDPEERRAIVELMCDFVEAMNPGVKLVRNAVILKDRDISGELKDVWNAVQAQRDREREEQLLQQRQQQHYHNITTQQMFPKVGGQPLQQQQQQHIYQQQQQHFENMEQNTGILVSNDQLELQPTAAFMMMHENNSVINNSNDEQHTGNSTEITVDHVEHLNLNASPPAEIINVASINKSNNDEQPNTNLIESSNLNTLNCNTGDEILNSSDQTDAGSGGPVVLATTVVANAGGATETNNTTVATSNLPLNEQSKAHRTAPATVTAVINNSHNITYPSANQQNNNSSKTSNATTPATSPTMVHTPNITEATTNINTTTNTNNSTNNTTTSAVPLNKATTTITTTTITSPPPKKDKLVGFLPNGCIFPRFKHNKNRDKDKEKESKSKDKDKEKDKDKDKEKTFMHALKKNKDKNKTNEHHHHVEKVTVTPAAAAAAAATPITTSTSASTTDASVVAADTKSNNHNHQHHNQSLISLENEVQKLDLGNGGSNSNDSSMFIKLKVPSTAIAK